MCSLKKTAFLKEYIREVEIGKYGKFKWKKGFFTAWRSGALRSCELRNRLFSIKDKNSCETETWFYYKIRNCAKRLLGDRPFIYIVVFQYILFSFVSFGGCYKYNCGRNKWNCGSYKYKCGSYKLNCGRNKYKIGCYNLFSGQNKYNRNYNK